MKRLVSMYVLSAMLILTGCAAQVAIGALDIASKMGAFDSSSTSSKPPQYYKGLNFGEEIEKFQINKHEVRVSNGYYNGAPCVYFVAYNEGRMEKWNAYLKNDMNDLRKLEEYRQMNETEKKKFIAASFLKFGFDVGHVEEKKTTETVSAPATDADVDSLIKDFTPRR